MKKSFLLKQYNIHKKKGRTANNALAKNGARPANIICSSLSALVWGGTSPIDFLVNL